MERQGPLAGPPTKADSGAGLLLPFPHTAESRGLAVAAFGASDDESSKGSFPTVHQKLSAFNARRSRGERAGQALPVLM